jgi:hypothetical protein
METQEKLSDEVSPDVKICCTYSFFFFRCLNSFLLVTLVSSVLDHRNVFEVDLYPNHNHAHWAKQKIYSLSIPYVIGLQPVF